MKRMSSLRRSRVFCNELSTKIVSPICATERTAMIVPRHDERTRTGAFVILPADELLSANINKKRRQCELPMTTDFDAPLRTQTIITDKVYFWLVIFSKRVRNPTNATARVAQCHDCNKIFETQRLQTLPPVLASMQRPTARGRRKI